MNDALEMIAENVRPVRLTLTREEVQYILVKREWEREQERSRLNVLLRLNYEKLSPSEQEVVYKQLNEGFAGLSEIERLEKQFEIARRIGLLPRLSVSAVADIIVGAGRDCSPDDRLLTTTQT
jgi:hypothetical protein